MKTRPIAEITQEALAVLYKEIGIVNTVRFVSQFTTGYGNYTQEREKLLADMQIPTIVDSIKKSRNNKAAKK